MAGYLLTQKTSALISIRLLIEFLMKLMKKTKVEGTSFVTTNGLVYLNARKLPGCGLVCRSE